MKRFKVSSSKLVSGMLMVCGLLVVSTFSPGHVKAQADQETRPPDPKKVARGEAEAKRMLLLMDKDNSGKVSKKEFMDFMEAEFERLDVNKDGELDVAELTQSRVQIRGHSR